MKKPFRLLVQLVDGLLVLVGDEVLRLGRARLGRVGERAMRVDAIQRQWRAPGGLGCVLVLASMPGGRVPGGQPDPRGHGGEGVRPGVPAERHADRLQVDDVATARAQLEAAGVEFVTATCDSGVWHQAIVSDPDGNPVALHHRYAPPKLKLVP